MAIRWDIRLIGITLFIFYVLGLASCFLGMMGLAFSTEIWRFLISDVVFIAIILFILSMLPVLFLNNMGRLGLIISADSCIFGIGLAGIESLTHSHSNWTIYLLLGCLFTFFIFFTSIYAAFCKNYNRKCLDFIALILTIRFILFFLMFLIPTGFVALFTIASDIVSPLIIPPFFIIYYFTDKKISEQFK